MSHRPHLITPPNVRTQDFAPQFNLKWFFKPFTQHTKFSLTLVSVLAWIYWLGSCPNEAKHHKKHKIKLLWRGSRPCVPARFELQSLSAKLTESRVKGRKCTSEPTVPMGPFHTTTETHSSLWIVSPFGVQSKETYFRVSCTRCVCAGWSTCTYMHRYTCCMRVLHFCLSSAVYAHSCRSKCLYVHRHDFVSVLVCIYVKESLCLQVTVVLSVETQQLMVQEHWCIERPLVEKIKHAERKAMSNKRQGVGGHLS